MSTAIPEPLGYYDQNEDVSFKTRLEQAFLAGASHMVFGADGYAAVRETAKRWVDEFVEIIGADPATKP